MGVRDGSKTNPYPIYRNLKAHQLPNGGKSDEWLTPPCILSKLGAFDLDPCAPRIRPWDTASRHISLPEDGLKATWHGRVWCNPPFNRKERPIWMERMSEYGTGIMLIPAATETEAFDRFVWRRATAVCFLKSRPHFHFIDGSRAPFNCGTAIVLIAYGGFNGAVLEQSSLGKTIYL